MDEEFLLTTAHNLEGYIIVKQCGIVFGETVFKNSALDQLSAGVSNMIDSLRFKATELAGQVELIENAREYAYNKLIEAAKKRGANAVIAIESDNTIGNGNMMYISLYGTAVKVMTPDEKEASDRKEAERKAAEEQEKIEAEERKKAIREQREKSDFAIEKDFISKISEMSSMIDIWKTWNEFPLKPDYPEIDQLIANKKEYERMYGRRNMDIEGAKQKIAEELLKIE